MYKNYYTFSFFSRQHSIYDFNFFIKRNWINKTIGFLKTKITFLYIAAKYENKQ